MSGTKVNTLINDGKHIQDLTSRLITVVAGKRTYVITAHQNETQSGFTAKTINLMSVSNQHCLVVEFHECLSLLYTMFC